ncbi:cysteine-rich receptor-like protein kinase 8 [Tanacetum coccineum]
MRQPTILLEWKRDDVESVTPEVETLTPSTSFQPTTPVVETRRSARQHVTPTWFKDYVTPAHVPRANQVSITPLQHTFHAFPCALIAQVTPTYFKEAIKDPEWCKEMNDELRALEINRTWEMTTLPPNKKAIGCHWIFKTKLKVDGSEDRRKARLVVSVRALLAVAAMKGWDVCQMDVSNAFLHGDLFEEFMQNPTSVHMQAVKHLLRYLLSSPEKVPLVIVFYLVNLLYLGSQRNSMLCQDHQQAEYRAIALTCCEVTWLVTLLKDLGIKDLGLVDLKCDN